MPRRPASRYPRAQADAERIVKLLQARATAARAEAVWADSTVETAGAHPAGPAAADPSPPRRHAAPRHSRPAATTTVAATGWTEPLTSTWSRRALAALLIPALILLIVVLI